MFCYPRGRCDGNVVRALHEAGYRGARTVRMLTTMHTFDPFEMPTTLQAFPHARFTYLKNVARARSFEGVQTFLVHLRRVRSWLELGKGSLMWCWKMVGSGTSLDIPGRLSDSDCGATSAKFSITSAGGKALVMSRIAR